MNGLKDNFDRTIDYLRISITDRCNLRCIYCMPSGGIVPMEHKEILRYEEIIRVLRIAAAMGVKRVRITGGEPLIRRNVSGFVRLVREIPGIRDVSLTTNGILLERFAEDLARAGLNRVNVSLDSLRPEKYREITRGGDLDAVLRGISAAEKAGLVPIKINVVPVRGVNDDEIEEFAKLTFKVPYQIRFIEFMPFGVQDIWTPERFLSVDEIRTRVEKVGTLVAAHMKKSGPARYFRFEGAAGVVGFISPLSHHFCGECNRLRLTADGKLRPCLFSETEIDLKPALRGGMPDDEIQRLLSLSISVKPKGHNIAIQEGDLEGLARHMKCRKRPMSKIGG
ncbi:MAG: GTP 3',8-cyclase MoaA [Nitrospirota bacterium]